MSNLPADFAFLAKWSEWCLATETQRNRHRVAQSFDAISAFANDILPHVDPICAFIDANQKADGSFEADVLNLYHMLLSLAEVAPAIESYDPEVIVVDGYETKLFVPDEKHRLRPAL